MLFATPKFLIQAIVATQKLGWQPQLYLALGLDRAVDHGDRPRERRPRLTRGARAIAFVKNPNDPVWRKDAAVRSTADPDALFAPGAKATDVYHWYGMAVAWTMVDALRRAGKRPTREPPRRRPQPEHDREPLPAPRHAPAHLERGTGSRSTRSTSTGTTTASGSTQPDRSPPAEPGRAPRHVGRGAHGTTVTPMPATVRPGRAPRPRGPASVAIPAGSRPRARLRYYAERFDVVEVDSPYYALPDPAVTRSAGRRKEAPDDFTFHVKASAAMTWSTRASRPTMRSGSSGRRSSRSRLCGKLRGVLLQYHPRFTKSAAAKAELARARRTSRAPRSARRVPPPLLAGRGRACRHALVPRTNGALRRLRWTAPAPARRTSPRGSRRRRTGWPHIRFHGRNAMTWNIRGTSAANRFDWLYAPEELRRRSSRSPTSPARWRRSTPSSTTTGTTSRRGARRSFGGFSTRPASPPRRRRASANRAPALLSAIQSPRARALRRPRPGRHRRGRALREGRGRAGRRARPRVVADGEAAPDDPSAWDAVMVFGGAMHPDQDAEHPWLGGEVAFLAERSRRASRRSASASAPSSRRACERGRCRPRRARRSRLVHGRADGRRCRRPRAGRAPAAPIDAFQWHYYTFELPDGAVQLAGQCERPPGVPPRRPCLGDQVPGAEVERTCSTAGSPRAATSCRSRWRRSRLRPAACFEGWNGHGPRALRRVPRRGGEARLGQLGRERVVPRPLVPRPT